MNIETIIKLKSNPTYIQFLRNNSYWYKLLNRDPSSFKDFELEFKNYTKDVKALRFSKTLEYIEVFQSIFSNLK